MKPVSEAVFANPLYVPTIGRLFHVIFKPPGPFGEFLQMRTRFDQCLFCRDVPNKVNEGLAELNQLDLCIVHLLKSRLDDERHPS